MLLKKSIWGIICLALFGISRTLAQAPSYVVQTFAGSYSIGDGGQAAAALLETPISAVRDGNGNLYILDSTNGRIRRVAPDGIISTITTVSAGNGIALGQKQCTLSGQCWATRGFTKSPSAFRWILQTAIIR